MNTQESFSRNRVSGSVTRPAMPDTTKKIYASGTGNFNTVNEARLGGNRGQRSSCSDIVTPMFSIRSNAGEIINNPFTKVVDTYDFGGTGPIVKYIGSISPWPVGTIDLATHTTNQLHANARFVLDSGWDGWQIAIPPSIVDVDSLQRKAKTTALSLVDASVATSLVSIGQLKQTILSLISPLSAIRSYLSRWNVNSAGKLMRKSGDGFVLASANEYLAFYYGLIPLVNDVKNLMAVANATISANQKRATARGSATGTKTTIENVFGNRTSNINSYIDTRFTRIDTVVAKSGILYVPTVDTLQKSLGLRLSDVPFALFDLVPWSFLVDYFINLGSLIQALSPRVGVTYLACWDTVNYQMDWRSEVVTTGIIGNIFSHTRVGNEWSTRSLRATVRTPSTVYDHVGLVVSPGNWKSLMKVAAVAALVIQQLGKFGPAMRYLKTVKTPRPGGSRLTVNL